MSGWCHWPFKAVAMNEGGGQCNTPFGPSMSFPNANDGVAGANGWIWGIVDQGLTTGTQTAVADWTVAFAWNNNNPSPLVQIMAHIYTNLFGWNFKAAINPQNQDYQWITSAGTLIAPSGIPAVNSCAGQTFVAVTMQNVSTVLYSNGVEIGSSAWGYGIRYLYNIYLGCDIAQKENTCMGGSIGPFIISRHPWSQAQVSQWSADPWGFIRPSAAPLLDAWRIPWEDLICDVQTRLAVIGDTRTRSAALADLGTQVAVAADIQARSSVTGDVQSRPRLMADARARAALIGDGQTRARMIADAQMRAALLADIQARAAAVADAQSRSSAAGDVQSRSALIADVTAREN
jgi:hypothetical protein